LNTDRHLPVLTEEVLEALGVSDRPGGVFVDATFGRGGHSRRILEQLGPGGRLLAFDRDTDAIEAGRAIRDPRFTLVHAAFSELESQVRALGVVPIGVAEPHHVLLVACPAPVPRAALGARLGVWAARCRRRWASR